MPGKISGADVYTKCGAHARFGAVAPADEVVAHEPYFISDEELFAMGARASGHVTYAVASTQDFSSYFASADSDSNDGLSAATAFQTIQHAVDVVRTR